MKLADQLIELRIMLNYLCDGFSSDEASKNNNLTLKYKILYLLKDEDLSPSRLVSQLCVAKGNLTNILKSIMNEGLVISYKNTSNSKNLNYRITERGLMNLNQFKDNMLEQFCSNCCSPRATVSEKLQEILQLLKGN